MFVNLPCRTHNYPVGQCFLTCHAELTIILLVNVFYLAMQNSQLSCWSMFFNLPCRTHNYPVGECFFNLPCRTHNYPVGQCFLTCHAELTIILLVNVFYLAMQNSQLSCWSMFFNLPCRTHNYPVGQCFLTCHAELTIILLVNVF